MGKIWNFLKDEDGLELTEYAVMGALIIVIGGATVLAIGEKIATVFTDILGMLNGD